MQQVAEVEQLEQLEDQLRVQDNLHQEQQLDLELQILEVVVEEELGKQTQHQVQVVEQVEVEEL